MKQIYLIGYEGCTASQLLSTLQNVGVEVLADVRELPLSRKKGLSKSSLSASLAEAEIEYLHFRELGDPKKGRDAAKSGDMMTFERVFLHHLASDPAQSALEELLMVAERKITCMLCFERCSEVCHRSYIADEAARRGFEILNLVADRADKYLDPNAQIPRYHPRQSLAAAE